MKRVGRILSVAYLSVLLVGIASLAVFSLPFTGLKAMNIATGSMQPHMPPGTLVIVHSVPLSSIKAGDVITFANPNNAKANITHRVKEVTKINGVTPAFITQGDANPVTDGAIVGGLVKGKVVGVLPIMGKFVMFLKTWLGIISLVYLPAIIIMLSEMWRLKRYYDRRQIHYRFAGYTPHHAQNVSAIGMVGDAVKFAGIVFVFTLAGMLVPVRALLSSQVELTNNVIATQGVVTPPVAEKYLLIREVCLRCSTDNTQTAVRRPIILIYNPTDSKVSLKNWTLRDNSGVLYTFGDRKLNKRSTLYIRPLLPSGGLGGLQVAGDRLALYDASAVKVDGLSWGTDTSELAPSIQNVTVGDHLVRKDKKLDTDAATDWKVTAIRCAGEPKTAHHDDSDEDEDKEDSSYLTDKPGLIPGTGAPVTLEEVDD